MTNLTTVCKEYFYVSIRYLIVSLDDVAVIDEIQMMRDPQRGWAWTRALLGKMTKLSLKILIHFT
jgi:hypothetical protein